MLSAATLITAALLGPPAPGRISIPPDARGTSRGVDAAATDAAATVLADGPEFQYRHRFTEGQDGPGQIGAYAVLPMDQAALFGGYEWLSVGEARYGRATVGLSGRLGRRLALGLAWRGYDAADRAFSGNAWDLSLFSEATSWLSVSAGVDGFNWPTFAGIKTRPAYVAGASIRPIMGSPLLTLGVEGRFAADGRGSDYEPRLGRAVLDLVPIEGLHAQAAFSREQDADRFWVGLAMAIGGLEMRGTAVVGGDRIAGQERTSFSDGGLAVTVRADPAESLYRPDLRKVQLTFVGDLRGGGGLLDAGPTVSDMTLRLDALARDPTIGEVAINIGRLEVGLATIDELRAGIRRLRKAGKKVVAFISGADDKTYLVAAACDEIRMDPIATLHVDGFALSVQYFAAALGKVGVRFDSVEIGAYKSGPDPMTRAEPRPEDEEVRREILARAHATLMEALTEDRELDEREAQDIIARGSFTAEAAKLAGLVDELSTPRDPSKMPTVEPARESYEELERPSRRWGQRPIVAIVPVAGTIAVRGGDNPLDFDTAAAIDAVAHLEAAMRDRDVVGVVLRVESPGGDVLASDLIWRAVRRLQEVKPIVTSMGDVAASGGYWIAAPTDMIFAEPNTVTGSIGVWTAKVDLSGFFELTGINSEVYRSSERADWDFPEKPLQPEDRERLQKNMQEYYDSFISRVAVGRKLPEGQVRQLAEGRVYTGERALELGLVDRLGGLVDAVREVRQRAGLAAGTPVDVQIPSRSMGLQAVVESLARSQLSLVDLLVDQMRRLSAWDGSVFALLPRRYDLVR